MLPSKVFKITFVLIFGLILTRPVLSTESTSLSADSDMVLGQKDAPVTIIEYASLSCQHCAKFHEETLPQFKKKYIDTGKVKLIFREFPLEKTAFWASIMARCAGEGRYFALIETFFKKQHSWSRAEDPYQALMKISQMGGLSSASIKQCAEDKALGDSIFQTRLEGEQRYNVRSTPSFVIDGETYPGALSIDKLEKLIKPLLP